MMRLKDRPLRATSLLLSLALLQGSFGPEAWAQVGPIVGSAVNRVGSVSGEVGAANAYNAANTGNLDALRPLNSTLLVQRTDFSPSPYLDASNAGPFLRQSESKGFTPAFKRLAPTRFAFAAGKDDDATAHHSPTANGASSRKNEIESGPATKGVGARVVRRFAELKNFFAGRKDGTPDASGDAVAETPSADSSAALKPSAPTQATSAPAPVPAPSAGKRSIKWFLGGMLVSQIGVEILGVSMPLLMHQKFGGFAALAQIAVFSSIASIFGQLAGGPIAHKLGIKATHVGATILRLLSITAMVVFLMGPHAPLIAAISPLAKFSALLNGYSPRLVLMAFYSFNGFMAGVASTAQKSIPTAILGNDRATLEKFSSLQQWLLETIGVTAPKAGGGLVQAFGFATAIAVYPLMLAVAVLMYLFGVRLPKEGKDASAPKAAVTSRFGRMLAPLAPMNRAIAATFGRLFGAIAKFVDALVLKAYLGRWIAKLGGRGKLTDDDEKTLLTRSTLGWTTAAMFSMIGFATLLLPTVLPVYAAMVVFGVAEVIASQKLYSLILSRTKDKAETVKVNAIAGAAFTALAALALNLTGILFDKTAGLTPFMIFTAAMIPLGLAVFFVRRMLKKADKADAPMTGKRPGGYKLLFKDPIMRWAFLGYAALNVLNPLLYQILSQTYGLLHAGGNSAAAIGTASWITALYSFGGLLGALYMWRESSLISDAKKKA